MDVLYLRRAVGIRCAHGSHSWIVVVVAGGRRGRAAFVQPAWPCAGAGAAAAPARAAGPGPGAARAGSECRAPASVSAAGAAARVRTDRDVAREQPARPSPDADAAQVAGRLPHAVQRPGESGGRLPRRRRHHPAVGELQHAAPVGAGRHRRAGRFQHQALGRLRSDPRRHRRRRGRDADLHERARGDRLCRSTTRNGMPPTSSASPTSSSVSCCSRSEFRCRPAARQSRFASPRAISRTLLAARRRATVSRMGRMGGSLSVSLAALAAAQLLFNPLGHAQEPGRRPSPGRAPGPGAGPAGAVSECRGPAAVCPAVCAALSAAGLRTDRDVARRQPARAPAGDDAAQVARRLRRALQRARASGRRLPRRRRDDPGVGDLQHAASVRAGSDRRAGRVQGEARGRHRPDRSAVASPPLAGALYLLAASAPPATTTLSAPATRRPCRGSVSSTWWSARCCWRSESRSRPAARRSRFASGSVRSRCRGPRPSCFPPCSNSSRGPARIC